MECNITCTTEKYNQNKIVLTNKIGKRLINWLQTLKIEGAEYMSKTK